MDVCVCVCFFLRLHCLVDRAQVLHMLVRGRMPELVRHFDDIDFSVDMVSERRFDCGGDVGDVFFFFFFLNPSVDG